MKTFVTLFLPSGIIMLVFTAIWSFAFPEQLLESLKFQDRTKLGTLFSVLMWIWLLGACATMAFLASLLAKSIQ